MRLFRRFKPTLPQLVASSTAIAVAVVALCAAIPALAARSSLQTYGPEQGLSDVGVSCLDQDRAGLLLVCTQHGVFTFDGRRFTNLGPAQGLRDGGQVYSLAVAPDGRIAIGYTDSVFVSTTSADAHHPPSSLSFRPVRHPEVSFYNDGYPNSLVAWRDGFVLVAHGTTFLVPPSGDPSAQLEAMPYDRAEEETLSGAQAVFSVRGHLWETFNDDRLCLADPGAVRCYDAADGLRSGPWLDVVAGSDGGLLARSASSVATLDAASHRWSVVALPDQGGSYVTYSSQLGLFRTPGGGLVTQSAHGLDILGPEGWKTLSDKDGVPAGSIMTAMTDAGGQFWLQVMGHGLVHWIGYARWEDMSTTEGLSAGLPWQTVRTRDGSVWVATDTGLDRIVRHDGTPEVAQVVPGPSFALAVAPNGDIWSSHDKDGGRIVHVSTGAVTRFQVPAVNVIFADPGGTMWIGTDGGLFRSDDPGAPLPIVAKVNGPDTPVLDIKPDGAGGVFYIAGNRLRHRHADGTDVQILGPWPGDGFEPLALVIDRTGSFWLGGAGGLFRLTHSADRIVSYRAIPAADTQTNTIPALMIDHRGWIWVGTTLGVSVFNGRQWVSIDTGSGLIGDDVDQNGIREDPDGSVWISTANGVSHLLDPTWLFHLQPLRVVISEATLGSHPITGQGVEYTRAVLAVQLGTPSFGVENSVHFEYRLSGVDSGWVSSSSGLIRYPFVPPGRHVLTIVGVDDLTHRTSAPMRLTVKIAWPWWQSWWFEAVATWFSLLVTVTTVYGVMRFRYRAVYRRQAELKRLVAEQTAQLRYVATHDELTGLLTRREIQARLAACLANGPAGDEIAIALLDIDHFKQINDTHGHLAGDDVLQTLGRVVSRFMREGDYAGRYGGEEILVVLVDHHGGAADRILEMHHTVRGAPYPSDDKVLRLTSSIGVAWAAHGDDWKSLLGRADAALYKAKRDGRDRIVEGPRREGTVRG